MVSVSIKVDLSSVDEQEILLRLARLHYDRGNFSSALPLLRALAEGEKYYKNKDFIQFPSIPIAKNLLGEMYERGEGVKPDLCQAMQWFLQASYNFCEAGFNNLRRLAELGHPQAQVNLGLAELNKENFEESVACFLLAANQDHPEGKYQLALMYVFGLGITKNYTIAMKLFSEAAQDPEAKKTVIRILQIEILKDLQQDLVKSQRAKVEFLLASLGASTEPAAPPTPELARVPAADVPPAP